MALPPLLASDVYAPDLKFKFNPFEDGDEDGDEDEDEDEGDMQPRNNVDIPTGIDIDEPKSVSSSLLSQLETKSECVPSLEPLGVGIELPQLQLDLKAVLDENEKAGMVRTTSLECNHCVTFAWVIPLPCVLSEEEEVVERMATWVYELE